MLALKPIPMPDKPANLPPDVAKKYDEIWEQSEKVLDDWSKHCGVVDEARNAKGKQTNLLLSVQLQQTAIDLHLKANQLRKDTVVLTEDHLIPVARVNETKAEEALAALKPKLEPVIRKAGYLPLEPNSNELPDWLYLYHPKWIAAKAAINAVRGGSAGLRDILQRLYNEIAETEAEIERITEKVFAGCL